MHSKRLSQSENQPIVLLLAEGWLWRAEQIHTFKAVLQSIPKGTCAKVICSKVYAALSRGDLQGNVKKTFDQVSSLQLPQGGSSNPEI